MVNVTGLAGGDEIVESADEYTIRAKTVLN
jgi:hypothetical protein